MSDSKSIVLGDQMTNLTQDGPNWQQIEGRQVGLNVGYMVTERYRVIRANMLTQIPSIFGTNATIGTAHFRGFRLITDTSGVLAKVELLFWDDYWDGSNINANPSETLVEMDQTLQQVPIELASYFSTLTPKNFSDVNECLSAGNFTGTSIQDGTTTLGYISSTSFKWEIPGIGGPWELTSALQIELLMEKIKGRDYVMRPTAVLRLTTMIAAGAVPTWGTIMANAGKKQLPPVAGLPGTSANWLVNTPRAERRKSGGTRVYQQVQEWLYNPDGWDIKLSADKLYVSA